MRTSGQLLIAGVFTTLAVLAFGEEIGWLLGFALTVEGLIEATVYAGGYKGHGPRILERFRWNYHVPVFLRWFVVCALAWHVELLPAFAVAQDIGWHVFSWKLPARESWIGRIAGGVDFGPVFLPNAYPLGVALSLVAYVITRVFF